MTSSALQALVQEWKRDFSALVYQCTDGLNSELNTMIMLSFRNRHRTSKQSNKTEIQFDRPQAYREQDLSISPSESGEKPEQPHRLSRTSSVFWDRDLQSNNVKNRAECCLKWLVTFTLHHLTDHCNRAYLLYSLNDPVRELQSLQAQILQSPAAGDDVIQKRG